MKKELSFETPIMGQEYAGTVGVLAVANENRFVSSNFSDPLTEFVAAIMGTDLASLQAELNVMAPPVRSARRFEYRKAADGLSFLSDLDDERAIGADFRRLEHKGEMVNVKTANRGLTYTLDRDEMVEGDTEQTARWLAAILLRNSKRRVQKMLDAAAANNNVVFKTATDPDFIVKQKLIAALEARGLFPNNILYGIGAWSMREAAYRTSTVPGALILGQMTAEQVASALMVDRLTISKDVYKTSTKKGTQFFLGNLIYAYYTDPIIGKEDGSNVKRFWTPCEGGEMMRVFVDESKPKTVEVMVEHYSAEAVVDSNGILKFTVAAS